MINYDEFLICITDASDGVRSAYRDVIADWSPEKPPITILFSEIGYKIAEEFRNIDKRKKTIIFSLIEQGMQSSDESFSTAVATGLIEALVTQCDKVPGLWDEMVPFLGPQSRQHAIAWMEFGS